MELGVRKQKILKAIVESFIATGDPVGSKTLLLETGIEVSPATVRNDMADLAARGYIYQPHTSAGRIPSQTGLRYYIDNLMTVLAPSSRAKDYIDSKLLSAADTPEGLLTECAKLLSELTGFVSVTTTPPASAARVHRLHFVATGRHTVMAILVTTTGMVKSKLLRLNFVVTSEVLSVLKETLNRVLSGVPLSEIGRPFMQTVAATYSEIFLMMPQVLTAIMDISQEAQVSKLCTCGETKLLFSPDVDSHTSRSILSFLSRPESVGNYLHSQKGALNIQIGSECLPPELKTAAVICARYEIEGELAGAVALFGPGRMDYAAALGFAAYLSERVSALLDEMVDIQNYNIDYIKETDMSKCSKPKDEEIKTTQEETVEVSEAPEEVKEEAPQEKTELQKLQDELKAQKDSYLRLAAEYDNYRKRTQQEKLSIFSDATAKAVEELLPLADSVTAALSSTADDDPHKEGIELIGNQLKKSLEKLGVEAFGEVGDTFDPVFHNAISMVQNPELEANTVAMVFQKGYKLKDKTIRPAMVQVANC